MRLQSSSGECLVWETREGYAHGKGQTGGMEMENENKAAGKPSKL